MNKQAIRRLIQGLFFVLLIVNSSVIFAFAQETDPYADSDGDGLTDWDETNRYKSRPDEPDTDGDSINDGVEVATGTSPLLEDSDGDFYLDAYEYANWNPEAARVQDRYILCPYIADLPNLAVEVTDNEVRTDFIFRKGSEFRAETAVNTIAQLAFQASWGNRMEMKSEFWTSGWARMGLMSQDIGFDAEVLATGAAANFAAPQPYLELLTESGFRSSFEAMSFFETQGSLMTAVDATAGLKLDGYINQEWDMDSASLVCNVTFTNTFDRLVRVASGIFDLGIGGEVYQSEIWDLSPVTLGKGESHSFKVNFPIGQGVGTGGGAKWVYQLNTGAAQLSI
ncbi:MAG: hypothetical protein ACW98Y_22105, partial [Candidatus Thorarchaeota archaeon]